MPHDLPTVIARTRAANRPNSHAGVLLAEILRLRSAVKSAYASGYEDARRDAAEIAPDHAEAIMAMTEDGWMLRAPADAEERLAALGVPPPPIRTTPLPDGENE